MIFKDKWNYSTDYDGIEILKKQAGQNNEEYNRLADEYEKATGTKSDKRKD